MIGIMEDIHRNTGFPAAPDQILMHDPRIGISGKCNGALGLKTVGCLQRGIEDQPAGDRIFLRIRACDRETSGGEPVEKELYRDRAPCRTRRATGA